MAGQRRGDIVIERQRTIGENRATIAVLADGLRIMADEDDIGMRHAGAKGLGAFLTKALVADLGDFIDQIDIEIDRARQAAKASRARIPEEYVFRGILKYSPSSAKSSI